MTVLHKVLVANRGEIALRIIRTAREMGLQTVAVYSDVDADSPHVWAAHEAVPLGDAAARPYLDSERIIAAAEQTAATLVHPGYGFLAENAAFARACDNAGLIFVGPAADTIELMGSKTSAKRFALDAGVPCIPGYSGDSQDEDRLFEESGAIGYPVMIKAAFGGGGRGMRLVAAPEDFEGALRSARSEAEKAFGNGQVILEKALSGARHIEFQVLADRHGQIVHLGERDCSVQRRHQKILEESPSPHIDEVLRTKMGEAAVRLAASCGYEGAGTVEFLLDSDGEFYFLEMNTRLQVEHPVTEMVTGLDLVAWQLKIAMAYALGFAQSDVTLRGHAIEMRLCAEDPANLSLPQTGEILYWRPPQGKGIRVDAGIVEGSLVGPHYDSMLAKIICWGEDRRESLQRLHYALHETGLLGLHTNRHQALGLITSQAFVSGDYSTAGMETLIADYPSPLTSAACQLALRIAAMLIYRRQHVGRGSLSAQPVTYRLHDGAQLRAVSVSESGADTFETSLDGADCRLRGLEYREHSCRLEVNGGLVLSVAAASAGCDWYIEYDCRHFKFRQVIAQASQLAASRDGNQLVAGMDGVVVGVPVQEGDAVQQGQTVMVIESMKMESVLVAPANLTVTRIAAAVGDSVGARQVLAELAPEAD